MITILMLLLVPSVSTDGVYYVTPSADDHCSSVHLHSQPCITLSQFATNPSDYLESNTTLIFLPGTHILNSVLNVSDTDNFILTSQFQANATLINCNGTGRFEFKWISYVRITDLAFIGCGGNRVLLLEQLIIEDSLFWGKKNGGTAMELLYTNADILGTAFINNKASYVNTEQNLTLGGALILTESNVVIINSSFTNNSAGVGGALYGEFSSMSFKNISIINSTFIGNHASIFGGALYFQFVDSSSIPMYLKSNSIDATMMSTRPLVKVFGCHFSDNSASLDGGVLAVYDINLDISNSQFVNFLVIGHFSVGAF